MNSIHTANPVQQRPALIKQSLMLSVLSVVLGSASAFVTFPAMIEQLRASGVSDDAIPGMGMMWGGLLFGVAVAAVLMAFVWRGANVARWITALLAVYGLVGALMHLGDVPGPSMWLSALTVVVNLLNVGGAALLFLPASAAWFKAMASYKAHQKAGAGTQAA